MMSEKQRFSVKAIILFVLMIPSLAWSQPNRPLKWEKVPSLPDSEGFAGMFAGASDGVLIAAGGANFPDKKPWEGGKKIWYDDIFLLRKGDTAWAKSDKKLPLPLAYGVSATYKNKLILVGGNSFDEYSSSVYSLELNKNKLRIDTLASLPFPLANMTGALIGDILYIAGGTHAADGAPTNVFLGYDLRSNQWIELPGWPGAARMQAISAALDDHFYLFSGIDVLANPDGSTRRIVLTDALKFVPAFQGKKLSGGEWVKLHDMPRGVAAGVSPAPTLGSGHVLFLGGLDQQTADHSDPLSHPGFTGEILTYHAKSDSWTTMGDIPQLDSRVTVPATWWDNKWMVISGEKGPGQRSPQVFSMSKATGFGWLNWTSLIVYLIGMLLIGFYFDKKDQTASNFFTASGKIPWWAAGLSIYGTQLSAITFMAVPAIVFATDWSLAIGSIMILATVPIVIRFYVPFFRRLSVTSAYEYLEHRFNRNVRVIGSLSFILFQLGRMGIVLFLPAIAIASVTGIDVYLLIAIMGIICVAYTVMGGMEAVIWSDVIQVVILIGGALLCLFIAVGSVEGGLSEVISIGMENSKFTVIHWGWDYNKLVLWVGVVGFFFLNIIPYTSDQSIVQRYLTVKDEKAVAKSLWTNGLVTLPAILIFFGLGTVLYVYYLTNPGKIPSENVGEILPYFVVQELPAGIAGLIIAGIFAASQSTLSSGMNSISAAYVTDIHPLFQKNTTDRQNLNNARITTIVVGLFGVGSAMLIAALQIQFIFNLFQEVLGIFGGALAGVFILGVFTRKANARGIVVGLIAGVSAVLFIKNNTDISVYLYGAISVLTTILIGYLASAIVPGKKNLDGLTYFTLNKGRSVDKDIAEQQEV